MVVVLPPASRDLVQAEEPQPCLFEDEEWTCVDFEYTMPWMQKLVQQRHFCSQGFETESQEDGTSMQEQEFRKARWRGVWCKINVRIFYEKQK